MSEFTESRDLSSVSYTANPQKLQNNIDGDRSGLFVNDWWWTQSLTNKIFGEPFLTSLNKVLGPFKVDTLGYAFTVA